MAEDDRCGEDDLDREQRDRVRERDIVQHGSYQQRDVRSHAGGAVEGKARQTGSARRRSQSSRTRASVSGSSRSSMLTMWLIFDRPYQEAGAGGGSGHREGPEPEKPARRRNSKYNNFVTPVIFSLTNTDAEPHDGGASRCCDISANGGTP